MYNDYRDLIAMVFEQRVRANPSYSMRSLARDLGMAPSSLSEVLRGRKGLSPRRAASIAKALKLPDWQASYFQNLVIKAHSRSHLNREKAAREIQKINRKNKLENLKKQTIDLLTSVQDMAVLESIRLKDFDGSEEWFSQKLSLNSEQLKTSIERLQKVGLLKVHSQTYWEDLQPFFSTTDGIPSESLRSFHKQVLKLAEEKLLKDGTSTKTIKSVIFSLHQSQLQEAKHILNDAIVKIVELAESSHDEKDHVMCFSSQLFFLTQPAENI
jgi:uncharacterized protein (TIGR02147 family)